MDKEMNFFDLCVAFGRALVRLCKACWQVLTRMLRLTYHYWWLVITLVILALAAAFYHTRQGNATHRVNAVAFLNGPTIQQFEEVFAPLSMQQVLPPDSPIEPFIKEKKVHSFTTYRVIDALHDSHADFIDFAGKIKATDTVNVTMHDRLCIQFQMKEKNLKYLPEVEHALLTMLNSDPALQQTYATYIVNLREEAAFNHRQALKLDSLTSSYYFNIPSTVQPLSYSGNGVNFYGDRRVRLFLQDIYKQRERMQQVDCRLQFAVAPVSLESHFAVDPKPVLGRMKALVLAFLLSWCFACLLAQIIDRRKALAEWLKAKE